jgi:hypothetical protein
MSLREEIYSCIWTFDRIGKEKFAIDECNLITNTILKLIEKRIDEILKEESESVFQRARETFHTSNTSFSDGLIAGMKRVKELLK